MLKCWKYRPHQNLFRRAQQEYHQGVEIYVAGAGNHQLCLKIQEPAVDELGGS